MFSFIKMLEGLILSAGPAVLRSVLNSILPDLNFYIKLSMLLLSIYIYTIFVLMYRCKYKTNSKPEISFVNSMYPVLPFIVYYIVVIGMSYVPHFAVQRIKFILSTTIVFYLITYIFWYTSVKLSHPDCFEKSFLQKILDFF
jgi:L-asparagine transporter-like permease